MTTPSMFQKALDRIDAVHGEDPQRVIVDGRSISSELHYARRMTGWLNRLYPEASESLQLAVRAQHLRRWQIPRSQYPMDRAGYHQWRKALAQSYAEQAGQILQQEGYDQAAIERIQFLIRRERMKTDPESQALEDTACLDFLENDLEAFAAGCEEEKLRVILSRTWAKMSPHARSRAMSIQLPPAIGRIIQSLR